MQYLKAISFYTKAIEKRHSHKQRFAYFTVAGILYRKLNEPNYKCLPLFCTHTRNIKIQIEMNIFWIFIALVMWLLEWIHKLWRCSILLWTTTEFVVIYCCCICARNSSYHISFCFVLCSFSAIIFNWHLL